MAACESTSKIGRDFERGILYGWPYFLSCQQPGSVARRGVILWWRNRSRIAGPGSKSASAVLAHLGWIGQAHSRGPAKSRNRCPERATKDLCERRVLPRQPWILL